MYKVLTKTYFSSDLNWKQNDSKVSSILATLKVVTYFTSEIKWSLSWFLILNNHLKCSLLIVAIPITDGGLGSAFELKQRACDKLTKGSTLS